MKEKKMREAGEAGMERRKKNKQKRKCTENEFEGCELQYDMDWLDCFLSCLFSRSLSPPLSFPSSFSHQVFSPPVLTAEGKTKARPEWLVGINIKKKSQHER